MIRNLVTTLAVSGLILMVAPPTLADSSETSMKNRTETSAPGSVAMTAELVKRSDGSWVIGKLSTDDILEERAKTLDSHPELQATFDRYRHALSRADVDELGSVWIMNPAERQAVTRLAKQNKRVSVSISDASLEVNGDRATVSFVQASKASKLPTPRKRRPGRRGLAAYDSAGAWDNVSTR